MRSIFHFGISPKFKLWQNRNIIAANSIACIVAVLAILLAILHSFIFSFEPSTLVLLAFSGMLLTIPFISKGGHIYLSRLLLVFITVVATLTVTIMRKYFSEGIP